MNSIDKYKKEFAKSGGTAKYKKYGKKAYSEMGKKSGEARRRKRLSPVSVDEQQAV